jgi:ring-1,2-phenylacetyl-CoA epoxidase subunit PaaD
MTAAATREDILDILTEVKDPELPMIDIVELGIVRAVVMDEDGVRVDVTPTYSGCPAMQVIERDIVSTLAAHGFAEARVNTIYSPAWTTDWMSDAGRRKLEDFGIAPPARGRDRLDGPGTVALTLSVRCPQCGSPDTRELSRFGSTACKALWVCSTCREPFDHFKTI